MGTLDQLDLDAVKRLYRADLPVPVDVLNLIHFKDEEAYKWYGVLTFPLLKAVGGEVGWAGVHAKSFVGEPRAEELLVVRYPNQRRFFAFLGSQPVLHRGRQLSADEGRSQIRGLIRPLSRLARCV